MTRRPVGPRRAALAAIVTAAAVATTSACVSSIGLDSSTSGAGSTSNAPANSTPAGASALAGADSASPTSTPTALATAKATSQVKASSKATGAAPSMPSPSPSAPPIKHRNPPKPLSGKVIVIDPGHDGGNFSHPKEINKIVDAGFGLRKACNSTGTETNAGYTEAAYTWSVANRLVKILKSEGATVVLTRHNNTGWGPCINTRAQIGNDAKADAVLSIHGDGNLAKGARGFHVIIAQRMMGGTKIQKASQRLADDIRKDYRAGTGMPFSTYTGGGVAETHRTDIGGLNLSTRPAVMIETGNMRSATDAALMSSKAWRQKAAEALAAGLRRYLSAGAK